MILKEADLAIGRVGNVVGVISGDKATVLFPDVDPDPVAPRNGVVVFRLPVPFHAKNLEGDPMPVAQTVQIGRGEVPVDSPFYLTALGPDLNGFVNPDAAVGLYHDIAVHPEYVFIGRCWGWTAHDPEDEEDDDTGSE